MRIITGSIQTKLIAAFLVITIFSVGTMIIYFAWTTSQALERRAGQQIKNSANIQAMAVGELLVRQADRLY
jgi:hypothetical protein